MVVFGNRTGLKPILTALLLSGLSLLSSNEPSTPLETAPLPLETALIKKGAPWRYLDDGSNQLKVWYAPTYDDSRWRTGNAELGFGDGDERTVVRSIRANTDKIITVYFRTEFQVKSRASIKFARIRILHDDGAVVYLNGKEIARFNMTTQTFHYKTLAKLELEASAERTFSLAKFDPSLLLKGRNHLAVEIHQASWTSDDLSFDFELLTSDGHPVVSRGPYLQTVTSTSAIVRWRTDLHTRSALWMGPDKSSLTRVVLTNTLRQGHLVRLKGLKPRTRYYYAIGNRNEGILGGGDDTTFFETAPTPGTDVPTRIWVVGDSGSGDVFAAFVRDAYLKFAGARHANVWLMLGDNAYASGTDQEYQKAMFEMYSVLLRNTCVWPTMGNHDAFSATSNTLSGPYYDIFELPRMGEAGGVASGTEAYYSFDYGQVHFICLNSMDVNRLNTGPMAKWVLADLTATTAKWVVAFFHHPPYSKGSHNSDDPLDSGGRMEDMRKIFLPILEKGGVDLVLTGHSHAYERSYLLDGHYGLSKTLTNAMILDRGDGRPSGDGAYAKPSSGPAANEGAVYVVTGCSGRLGGGTFDHPAMHIAMATLGSLVLDVSGDRLDAQFVDIVGRVQDTFTIRKGLKRSLRRIEPNISVSKGGTQNLILDAGSALAGGSYQVAGSFSTSPGLQFGNLKVPLNPDFWFYTVLGSSNSSVFVRTHGVLDSKGQASAKLVFPGVTMPSIVGLELFHAFVAKDGNGFWRHASNSVKLVLVK